MSRPSSRSPFPAPSPAGPCWMRRRWIPWSAPWSACRSLAPHRLCERPCTRGSRLPTRSTLQGKPCAQDAAPASPSPFLPSCCANAAIAAPRRSSSCPGMSLPAGTASTSRRCGREPCGIPSSTAVPFPWINALGTADRTRPQTRHCRGCSGTTWELRWQIGTTAVMPSRRPGNPWLFCRPTRAHRSRFPAARTPLQQDSGWKLPECPGIHWLRSDQDQCASTFAITLSNLAESFAAPFKLRWSVLKASSSA